MWLNPAATVPAGATFLMTFGNNKCLLDPVSTVTGFSVKKLLYCPNPSSDCDSLPQMLRAHIVSAPSLRSESS